MSNRWRVSVLLVPILLVLSTLVLSAAPAEAASRTLHRGSKGPAVKVLEARLAYLGLLPRSAVDRRYRAATVKAVRKFQRLRGLRVTGRANPRTANAVHAAYVKAATPPPAPTWRPPSWAAPKVTAHRGGAAEAPENTLAAIRHGVATGADAVEFDLRTTADGRLVLMHDATLGRTTNCTGYVANRTLAQLGPCRTDRGQQPIPTFDQVAAYLATTTGVDIDAELKDQGTSALTDAELDRFIDTVQTNGLSARTYVQSFDKALFPRVSARDASLPLVWLSHTVLYVSAVRAAGADVASVSLSALARENVLVYQRNGVPIWTWTARTRADLERAWSLGVDSVGADIPTTAVALYR